MQIRTTMLVTLVTITCTVGVQIPGSVAVAAPSASGVESAMSRSVRVWAPTAVSRHTTVPITGAVSPVSGRPTLVLQRRAANRWKTLAKTRARADGRARWLVTPRRTSTYRVLSRGPGASRVQATTRIRVRPARRTPWVTGYYAGWFWDQGYAPDQIAMRDMTHLVFGRVAPGGGSLGGRPGAVVPGAGTAHQLSASPYPGTTVEDYLVAKAHRAGVKVLLMLGGDGFDGRGFVASTEPGVRQRFVTSVVDYLVAHNYDGVDVDWENCIGGEAWECGRRISTRAAARRLQRLVIDLRAEMSQRKAFANDPGLVTFPGYPVNINDLNKGKVARWQARMPWLVDQYNLMSYGVGTTWSGAGWDSWFSGALDGESATTPVSIDSSIDAYVASGATRDKIGMGIGLYGIYFGPGITGPRQPTDNNEIYQVDDVALSYRRLVDLGYLSHGTEHWDQEASSAYRSYGPPGYVPPTEPGLPPREAAGFLSYENARSIAAKARYARFGGAAGAIIWTLNYGALEDGSNPLLGVIGREFLRRASIAP